MIAEIVSLSGYEAQVAARMIEDERMAMEFSIASGPDDHPLIPGTGGFREGSMGPARPGKEWRVSGSVFLHGPAWANIYGGNLC